MGLYAGNFQTRFGQSQTDLGLKMVLVCLRCVLYLCVISWYLNNMQIVVLGVVRPEMAMDFSSKEVEPRLMRGLCMDSPRTIFEDC